MEVVKLSPMEVANEFVRQYYLILRESPANLYKFYQESSFLGWPETDGDMTPVTTLSGIQDKIKVSEHKDGTTEIKTIDAQDTLDDAVLVTVTGWVTAKDREKKYFLQTFILAKQETGFFVLNDILRILDVLSPITTADENNGGTNYQPAVPSKQNSVVESTEVKVVPTPVPVITTSVDSPKKLCPLSPLPLDVKAGSPVALVPKVTYASMVSKAAPVSPPKVTAVTSNVCNQAMPSTPLATGAAKVSIPSDAALKESVPSTKDTTKLPRSGTNPCPPNVSTNGEACKGIYIGRLPYEITKQGIVDIVKQFGLVSRNPDSIKIRRHEDGFCCGFVEFESADAARRAVEVRYVQFGTEDELSYISYKRSNRGNDDRRWSPTGQKERFQNGNRGSGQSRSASREKERFQNGYRGSGQSRSASREKGRFQNGNRGSGQSRSAASREVAWAKN